MHSMSGQFYRYLSKKLINYFKSNLHAGDKFFVQFDEENQVEIFYNTLKNSNNFDLSVSVEEFVYKHDMGNEFKTYALSVGNIKLVVASSLDVNVDYLVTLRNQVVTQEGVWKDCALLIICYESIDSICEGMRDLESKGLPFDVNLISKNLVSEIEESKELSKVNKEITKFYLSKKEEDLFQTNLWDYEEILSILDNGKIDREDYVKLGLFPDEELKEFPNVRSIRSRLSENSDMYEDVKIIKNSGDSKSKLEKKFDSIGVKALNDDENWSFVDFKLLKKSAESLKKNKKTLLYIENNNKFTNEGLTYWEKAKSHTAAGQRTRYILIFNNQDLDSVSLDFSFDGRVYAANLIKKPDYVTAAGKKLKVAFNLNSEKLTSKKFVYEHNKSKFTFFIIVVPAKESFFESIKHRYSITGSAKKLKITVTNDENDEEVSFGEGHIVKEMEVDSNDNLILNSHELSQYKIIISENSPGWKEEDLGFYLVINDISIPFIIKESSKKTFPVKSIVMWKNKRENKENIVFNGIKAFQNSNVFYIEDAFKEYLAMEYQIINENIFYGVKDVGNNIEKEDVLLSDDLWEAYQNIFDYYEQVNNVPSLTYLNNDLKDLYEDFINIFNKEVSEIQEGSILSNDKIKLDLLKLGVIKDNNNILLSSLSPLNIAYQLEISNQCEDEVLKENILERLIPNNLLPYLFDGKNHLYKPIYQVDAHEWVIYEKSEDVSVGTTNAFLANLVKEKLEQFVAHFNYLFDINSKSPIKLNVININDDAEFVKGIFNFMMARLLDKSKSIIPVEINIYSNKRSTLEKFFECTNKDQLSDLFGIKISTGKLDHSDIIRLIQNNITYFKQESAHVEDYEYAHISFYKSGYGDKAAEDNMDQIETGLSLNGLVSDISSITVHSDYRSGFGTKNIHDKSNILVKTAINLNELSKNNGNSGINAYSKGKTIIAKPMPINDNTIELLYKKSHWVTFIEPNFGLDYFNNSSDIIIIHYSDQYTSSNHYDTITVTNRSNQYEMIIKEFLRIHDIEITPEELESLIKMFNTINGEWLLRTIVSNNSNYDREKLSIISAIKYALAILDHPEIIWIPISMEEILRIAGNIKLDKNEGIFSYKIKNEPGVHSDDLLFIGVHESKINGDLKVYYHPIEVKIGHNFSPVINKGKNQLDNTYNLLKEQLNKHSGNHQFRNKFFRNFFVQLLLANEQKLFINDIWRDKGFNKLDNYKAKLLNDEYEIVEDLKDIIGIGSLISFEKDNDFLSINMEEDKQIIRLTEDYAFMGLVDSIENIHEKIHSNKTDISADKLLYSIELDLGSEISIYPPIHVPVGGGQNSPIGVSGDVRAYIGNVESSNHKVFWEFGNPKLPNRHMLIQGKSGQGKTYFIQRIIKELSQQGVSTLIIDYTDGFKKKELEDEFKSDLKDKLKIYNVIKDKFALNPFKRNLIELDEDEYYPEDNNSIASRFKSTISSVYSKLGPQQLNVVYQSVLNGIEKYGEDMNLNILKNELIADDTSQAGTVLNQLNELLDKNPFDAGEKFDWSLLNKGNGNVIIVQLTGLSKDIQKIIAEFVLWDLWNYKEQNGDVDNPFAIVLDEAHNLDFRSSAPAGKILIEGRKHGWAGLFATQSIKGQMNSEEISNFDNVDEKIFFHPTDSSINDVAGQISTKEKKIWTDNLRKLKKGQCIVYGSILDKTGDLKQSKPVVVDVAEIISEGEHDSQENDFNFS